MSVKYVPVQWNRTKWVYDGAMLVGVGVYLWVFLYIAPPQLGHALSIDGAILRARAFGSCAFVMLTIILCIGPLARLDQRFLPLLYNRRHFGVMTCIVALSHAYYVLGWYLRSSQPYGSRQSFSPTRALASWPASRSRRWGSSP